jgi:Glycosyltransferase family 87
MRTVSAMTHLAERSHFEMPLRTRSELRFAAGIAILIAMVTVFNIISIWKLGPNGFEHPNRGLPYWDFTNLWAGSRMVVEGHISNLFDVNAYRAELRAMFDPNLRDHEWSYPPSILLIGVPLSLLPIFWSYILWTVGTIVCLHFAIRPAKLPFDAHLAVLTAPSVGASIFFGQNGCLTAALLIGGLFATRSRPVLAGILFGILTIKPQMGLLIPVCLIASFNIRCIVSALVTTILIAVMTGVFFGLDAWLHFFHETRAFMTQVLEYPYPHPYQYIQFTFFVMSRSFGLDLPASYTIQAIATLICMIAVFYLWWPPNQIDHLSKVSVTALLSIMATPYGYSYDTVPYCFAIVVWFLRSSSPNRYFFAALWIVAAFTHLVTTLIGNINVLFPTALAIFCFMEIRKDQNHMRAEKELTAQP